MKRLENLKITIEQAKRELYQGDHYILDGVWDISVGEVLIDQEMYEHHDCLWQFEDFAHNYNQGCIIWTGSFETW